MPSPRAYNSLLASGVRQAPSLSELGSTTSIPYEAAVTEVRIKGDEEKMRFLEKRHPSQIHVRRCVAVSTAALALVTVEATVAFRWVHRESLALHSCRQQHLPQVREEQEEQVAADLELLEQHLEATYRARASPTFY